MAKSTTTTKASATKAASTAKTAPAAKAEAKTTEKKADTTKVATTTAKPEPKKETKPAAKADTKKAPAKKPAAKQADIVQEVFVEYNGDQILTEDIVNRIKDKYQGEGHRVGAIKSLRVYVNLEERKAYYVINDKTDESGEQFVEF